ncbi:MAG: type II secretion system protein [Candidatus Paceibacterota bacterium]|jgi:type II secretory pathway pseudopilin PulG
MRKSFYKAFTLIELLVIIAIIGILSGLIVVSMNGSINSANDAKRKAGVDVIRKALLIYGTLNGMTYPVQATPCNIGQGGSCSTAFTNAIAELLPNPPTDPISGNYYTYVSSGTNFTVTSSLSNGSFYRYFSLTGFSTTTAQVFTSSTTWTVPVGCNYVEVLVVAGGGGGGSSFASSGGAGGGGAGGLIYNPSHAVTPSAVMTVTIGNGGAPGGTGANQPGLVGGNSVFGITGNFLTAIGGGGGGQISANGSPGGSGGGGGFNGYSSVRYGGSATSGQGNAGGNTSLLSWAGGAGGGGAGGNWWR